MKWRLNRYSRVFFSFMIVLTMILSQSQNLVYSLDDDHVVVSTETTTDETQETEKTEEKVEETEVKKEEKEEKKETKTEVKKAEETQEVKEDTVKTDFVYEDKDVKITAVASKEAKLSENVTLEAKKLNSKAYKEAVKTIKKDLKVSEDEDTEFVLYDVYFKDGNKTIEPEKGNVKVSMDFKKDLQLEDKVSKEEVTIVHIKNDGKTEELKGKVEVKKGELEGLTFNTKSFSPMGAMIRKAPADSGDVLTSPYNLMGNSNSWINRDKTYLEVEGTKINELTSVPEYANFKLHLVYSLPTYEDSNFNGFQNGEQVVYPLPDWIRSVDVTSGEIPDKGNWKIENGNMIITYLPEFLEKDNRYGIETEIDIVGVVNSTYTDGGSSNSINLNYLGTEENIKSTTKRTSGVLNFDLKKTWTNNIKRYVDAGEGAIKYAGYELEVKAGKINEPDNHNKRDIEGVSIKDFFNTFESYSFANTNYEKNDDLLKFITHENVTIQIKSPDLKSADGFKYETIYANKSAQTDSEGRTITITHIENKAEMDMKLTGVLHPDESIIISYDAKIDEEMYEHDPHGYDENGKCETGDETRDSIPDPNDPNRSERSWIDRIATNRAEATTKSIDDGGHPESSEVNTNDNGNYYLTFKKTWLYKGPAPEEWYDPSGGASGYRSGYMISINEGNLMDISGYKVSDDLEKYNQELISDIILSTGRDESDEVSRLTLDQIKSGNVPNEWTGTTTKEIHYTFPEGTTSNMRLIFTTKKINTNGVPKIQAENGVRLIEKDGQDDCQDTYGAYKKWEVPGATVTKRLLNADVTTGKIRWQTTIDDGIVIKEGSVYNDAIYAIITDREFDQTKNDYEIKDAVETKLGNAEDKKYHNFGESTADLELDLIATDVDKVDGTVNGKLVEGLHYEVVKLNDDELSELYDSDNIFKQGLTGGFRIKFLKEIKSEVLVQYTSYADFSKVSFKGQYLNKMKYVPQTGDNGFVDDADYWFNAEGAIQKSVNPLNSDNYDITWKLRVNDGKSQMKANLIVKDELPEGLTFDLKDLKPTEYWYKESDKGSQINGSADIIASFDTSKIETNGTKQTFTGEYFDAEYDSSTRIITITFKKANRGMAEFWIKTVPCKEDLLKANSGTKLQYTNVVDLYNSASEYHMASAKAYAEFETKVLDKVKTYNENTAPYVNYTITVNKGSADLSDDDEIIVEDDGLQNPIVFQKSSLDIRDKDNQPYKVGDAVSEEERTYTYKAKENGGFVLHLPDEMKFTISYKAYAPGVEGDKLNTTNKVKLYGKNLKDISTSAGQEDDEYVKPKAETRVKDRVTINKSDKDTGKSIENAEFALYEAVGENYSADAKIGTFTSDGDGKAYTYREAEGYSRLTVEPGKVYVIKETKAATGYVLDKDLTIKFYFIPLTSDITDADKEVITKLKTNPNYSDIQLINSGFQDFEFDVTNTKIPTFDLPVEKTWASDTENDRPESITFKLYADGEAYPSEAKQKTITLTKDDLTSENVWEKAFTDLPITDGEGNPIEYSISEDAVDMYSSTKGTKTTVKYNTSDFTKETETTYTYSGDPLQYTNTKSTYNRGIRGTIWFDTQKDGDQCTYDTNNDSPLSGVPVYLYDENGDEVASTTTDKNGNYEFTNLPAGTFEIRVDYDGYVTGAIPDGFFAYAGQNGRIDSIGKQTETEGKKGAVISNVKLPTDKWISDNANNAEARYDDRGTDGNPFVNTTGQKIINDTILAGTEKTEDTYIVGSQNVGFIKTTPSKKETDHAVDENATPETEDAVVYDTVVEGDTITYQISYVNPSPDTATIKITDTLDRGVDFISASDNGEYGKDLVAGDPKEGKDPNDRTVRWNLSVPAYGRGTVTVTVKVNEAGRTKGYVDNTAKVQINKDAEQSTETVENKVEKYTRSIEGIVWLDKDKNGTSDDDALQKDVTVSLYVLEDGKYVPVKDADDKEVTTKTDENGHYEFTDLEPGTYKVVFDDPRTNTNKQVNQPAEDKNFSVDKEDEHIIENIKLPTDYDIFHNNNFKQYPNTEFENKNYNQPDLNLGVITPVKSLSGKAWFDNGTDSSYKDGTLDNEDKGIKSVPVTLTKVEDGKTKYAEVDKDGKVTGWVDEPNENTVLLTDENGNYKFTNLESGDYSVLFDHDAPVTDKADEAASDKSIADQVSGDKLSAKIAKATIPSDDEILDLMKDNSSLVTKTNDGTWEYELPDQNAGFVKYTKSITGTVWLEDLGDDDGSLDNGEERLKGIKVQLVDEDGNVVAETETDEKGEYIFENVESGDYSIVFDTDRPVTVKEADGVDSPNNSKVVQTEDGKSKIEKVNVPTDKQIYDMLQDDDTVIDEKGNYNIPDQNAGVTQYTRSVEGIVWLDGDRDGHADKDTDVRQESIKVQLLDKDGKVVKETTTDKDGHYEFKDLEPGKYDIVFDDDRVVTIQSDEADPNNSIASQEHKITSITLPTDYEIAEAKKDNPDYVDEKGNYNVPDQNMGLIVYTKSITGTVWLEDLGDDDGSLDDGEERLKGIKVQLIDKDGNVVDEVETDKDGNYIFKDVESGDYSIVFDTDRPVTIKEADGVDSPNNSKVVQTEDGKSKIEKVNVPTDKEIYKMLQDDPEVIDENGNYNVPDQNAGVVQYSRSVEGIVWLDGDRDGHADNAKDVRQEGIKVQLLDKDGNVVKETTTDKNGHYAFKDLEPGDYDIVFEDDRVVTTQSDKADPNNSIASKNHKITSISLPTDAQIAERKITDPNYVDENGNYNVPDQNMGLVQFTREITGFVFKDNNHSDEYDKGEKLFKDSTVTLYRKNDKGEYVEVAKTKTDENGNYSFDNLEPGYYQIVFDVDTNIYDVIDPKDQDNGSKIDKKQYIYDIYLPTDEELFEDEKYKDTVDEDGHYLVPFQNAGYEVKVISVDVKKVWDDEDDLDGLRTDSITVRLLQNGEEIASKDITSKDEWKATFTHLDQYDDDENEFTYTISEDKVEDYETSISGDMSEGFTITNTHTPKDPENPDEDDPKKHSDKDKDKEDKEEKFKETEEKKTVDTSDNTNMFSYIALSITSFLLIVLMDLKKRFE